MAVALAMAVAVLLVEQAQSFLLAMVLAEAEAEEMLYGPQFQQPVVRAACMAAVAVAPVIMALSLLRVVLVRPV